jgi:DNA-binding transcriptional MerR regulator
LHYSHPTQATQQATAHVPDRTYTISELAREFGITTRTIRFYEEKGLISPRREGQKRLYSPADRVRIKLILRGKRIGMTLRECVEVIDMYQPGHNNAEQLHSLITTVKARRRKLLQQQKDIDEMLAGLDEVQDLCESALEEDAASRHATGTTQATHRKSL